MEKNWYFCFKQNYHGQIKENEGGMAHNMHGGDKKCTQTSDDKLVGHNLKDPHTDRQTDRQSDMHIHMDE